jgi:hypothetical protein
VRVVVYCEGDTEELILKPLLAPYRERLAGCGYGLDVHIFNGAPELKRKIGAATRAALQHGVERVFGLIDLYGAPIVWPRNVLQSDDPLAARCEYAREQMRSWVPSDIRDRFHPHLAVHELEAWLLADSQALSDEMGRKVGPWPRPEEVDFDKPPAALLNELFHTRPNKKRYDKKVDGRMLFGKVNVDTVYQMCPNFRAFVDDLLALCK